MESKRGGEEAKMNSIQSAAGNEGVEVGGGLSVYVLLFTVPLTT